MNFKSNSNDSLLKTSVTSPGDSPVDSTDKAVHRRGQMKACKRVSDAVVNYQKDRIISLTKKAVEADTAPQNILEDGFMSGMAIVEKKMKNGKMFVPEVLMAAKTAKMGIDTLIRNHSPKELDINEGTVVIGSLKGELHHFGKEIVSLMCEYAGLNVIDLGEDLNAEQFIRKAKGHQADIVCLTSFFSPVNLPSTMDEIEKITKAFQDQNQDQAPKILIASEWLTRSFIKKIGAHAHAPTAMIAASKAQDLIPN